MLDDTLDTADSEQSEAHIINSLRGKQDVAHEECTLVESSDSLFVDDSQSPTRNSGHYVSDDLYEIMAIFIGPCMCPLLA